MSPNSHAGVFYHSRDLRDVHQGIVRYTHSWKQGFGNVSRAYVVIRKFTKAIGLTTSYISFTAKTQKSLNKKSAPWASSEVLALCFGDDFGFGFAVRPLR
jgi:hypothetical protein